MKNNTIPNIFLSLLIISIIVCVVFAFIEPKISILCIPFIIVFISILMWFATKISINDAEEETDEQKIDANLKESSSAVVIVFISLAIVCAIMYFVIMSMRASCHGFYMVFK